MADARSFLAIAARPLAHHKGLALLAELDHTLDALRDRGLLCALLHIKIDTAVRAPFHVLGGPALSLQLVVASKQLHNSGPVRGQNRLSIGVKRLGLL